MQCVTVSAKESFGYFNSHMLAYRTHSYGLYVTSQNCRNLKCACQETCILEREREGGREGGTREREREREREGERERGGGRERERRIIISPKP